MGIKIRKRSHQGQEKSYQKSRKSSQGQEKKIYHDQEKFIKTKRTSQRYNPKDSGNYQK
jgi:hypothetical protein